MADDEAEGGSQTSQEVMAQEALSDEVLDAMDLPALAREANKAYRAYGAAVRRSLRHALRVGQVLRVVKDRLRHGAFGDWVEANTDIPPRTASRYMRVVDRWERLQAEKTANLADLTIERLAAPEPTRRAPGLLAPPSPPHDAAPVLEGEVVAPPAEQAPDAAASTEPEATAETVPQPSPTPSSSLSSSAPEVPEAPSAPAVQQPPAPPPAATLRARMEAEAMRECHQAMKGIGNCILTIRRHRAIFDKRKSEDDTEELRTLFEELRELVEMPSPES